MPGEHQVLAMILLSGQLDRYNSRSGEGLLTFNIYEQDMDEYSQVIRNKTGQEYLIMLIPTSDSKELNEFRDETMEETTERFRRRMNALIQDIAVIRGQEKDEFREFIKAQVVGEGLIKEVNDGAEDRRLRKSYKQTNEAKA